MSYSTRDIGKEKLKDFRPLKILNIYKDDIL